MTVSEETQHPIWQFANAVQSLGYSRNIGTGKTVPLPPDADDTVATYKHAHTGRKVCVWPIRTTDDANAVGDVADQHGFYFLQLGRPMPVGDDTFQVDHTAGPTPLGNNARAYVGLRGPAKNGHSGLQVWVIAAPPPNIPVDYAGQMVADRLDRSLAYPLAARLDLAYHSPTGFECGYHGSGPSQLAVAIVADLFGETAAGDPALTRRIRDRVIARQPSDRHWVVGEDRVHDALADAKEAAS